MRVTTNMAIRSSMHDLTRAMTRLRAGQADLATGKVLRTVSDDPLRAMDALNIRGELRRTEQRARVADDARARLAMADDALVSSLDLMARAKELTVRASSSGVADGPTRAAIATELTALRAELLRIANTEHLGRPIFNGTAAGPAYDADTGAYLGNAAAIHRDVAAGTTVVTNLTGEQVFGAQGGPAGDLFAVIERLATAVTAGDQPAIEIEHANLDAATERLQVATAEIGSRAAGLERIRARAAAGEAGLRERLSVTEDVDLAEALVGVQADEQAYQAALQATARVLAPSLLDFLR